MVLGYGCNVLSFSLTHMDWLPPAFEAVFRIINKQMNESYNPWAEWFATHLKMCKPFNCYLFSQQRPNGSCYNYWISRDRIRKVRRGQHRMGPSGRVLLVWDHRAQHPNSTFVVWLSIIEARSLTGANTWSCYLMSLVSYINPWSDLEHSVCRWLHKFTLAHKPRPERKQSRPSKNQKMDLTQNTKPCAPNASSFPLEFHESREFFSAYGLWSLSLLIGKQRKRWPWKCPLTNGNLRHQEHFCGSMISPNQWGQTC